MINPLPRRTFTRLRGKRLKLKPLSPGRHELNFCGILPEMAQAVTYTLIVE